MPHRSETTPRERTLSWAVGALALAAPLAIGGAHAATQVVLSLAALALLIAYLRVGDRGVMAVPLTWACAVAVGYTALQLVPLPAFVVGLVSPAAHELRSETGAGWLMPLTVDAPATWLALARGFACFGLLLMVGTHSRSHRLARTILLALSLVGTVLATITLVQRLVGAHAILGFYVPRNMPGGGFFGTFVNGNHAASVLALSSLISAGLALDAKEGKRFFFLASAVLSGAVVFYTASRAGALGFGVGGLLLASVALVRRLGWATGLLTALAMMAVASGATLWLADGLRSRLLPTAGEGLYENQKLRGWRDAASMAVSYRWSGVGRGAFEAPAAAYRQDDEGVRLVYPENLLVESATEWGIPLTLLLMGLVALPLAGVARGLSGRELGVIGAAAGVLAVLVHEMADFGLELPGVAFPTVIALGVVMGRVERKQDRRAEEPRAPLPTRWVVAGLAAWSVALLGAAWAAPRTLAADFENVARAYRDKSAELPSLLAAAVARHPADDHLELLAAEDALARRDKDAMRHLNRALRLHPANWQAHDLAARTLLGMGRRPQAALELRLAIERGMPVSWDELWRALGDKIVDGVPQRPESLMKVAHALVARHRPEEADEACRRAVAAANPPGPFLIERVQVAMESNDARLLVASAQALLETQPDEEAGAVALRALAQSGDAKATDAALEMLTKQHPESSLLTLLGAQLLVDRGDLSGARELLKHAGDGSYSLSDRLRAEELLAKIADRQGDVDGAVLARARARVLGHKLNDTSAVP
jgi:tetratricopeptide (TPR) repeat protein